ncbi:unnamed protein product [Paramecium pentaurelia]|uniref:Uncharacterized protein n=1 Tax=Paramecium pentaurelia TaxID=43138 RepID=A0A8S1YAS7_9CILI|nr:unnamed protein product [Paramecium pentaurelia]
MAKTSIELKQVQYTIHIQPGLAAVQICQIYSTKQNKDQSQLEYLFKIDQNSAVSKNDQSLWSNKRVRRGQKKYQKGIEDGKTIVISQEDQEISNIKKAKIGCLSPGKLLKNQFVHIQPLQVFLNQFSL